MSALNIVRKPMMVLSLLASPSVTKTWHSPFKTANSQRTFLLTTQVVVDQDVSVWYCHLGENFKNV